MIVEGLEFNLILMNTGITYQPSVEQNPYRLPGSQNKSRRWRARHLVRRLKSTQALRLASDRPGWSSARARPELGLSSASDRQHAVIVEARADGRQGDDAAEDHAEAATAVAEREACEVKVGVRGQVKG